VEAGRGGRITNGNCFMHAFYFPFLLKPPADACPKFKFNTKQKVEVEARRVGLEENVQL
jgi:hypothetical protein